jgi:histone H3/H4
MNNETNFENFPEMKSHCADRIGQKTAAAVGRIARSAGEKFDLAVDRLESCAGSVKSCLDTMSEEGAEGLKRRAIDYARQEPLNALLLALGTGLLLGWATKRR